MKKMLILLAIALLAAPAFAGGILAQKDIPVKMLIDKTVTLTVNPVEILLTILDPNAGGSAQVYRGYTTVTMTHNFPVIVNAMIVPVGIALGPTAAYKVALAGDGTGISGTVSVTMPQTAAEWVAKTSVDNLSFYPPAPAPPSGSGRIFYVGAAVVNVDITFAPSLLTAQQVASVGLTVSDNL